MPHLMVDYSSNLEDALDMSAFCDCLRVAATKLDTFPDAGIRVRAVRVDHYSIADGDPKHGFIDVSVRLRGGRPLDVRQHATEALFAAAQDFVAPYMEQHSIALSLEMRDIDPDLAPKTGSIRQHLTEA